MAWWSKRVDRTGTVSEPVRTNFDLTVNGPHGGWVSDPAIGDPLLGWPSGIGSSPPVWWVGASAGYPIGPNSSYRAATLPAVTYATSQITGPISRLPWRVYRYDTLKGVADWENRRKSLATPVWMVDPQLAGTIPGTGFSHVRWGDRMTGSTFWAEWVKAALWHGDGYIYYQEDINGQPKVGTLRIIHPSHVHEDSQGWYLSDDEGGQVRIDDDGYIMLDMRTPGRMVRLRGPLPGGVLGTHGLDLAVASAVRDYSQNVYTSGVPYGYLKVTTPNMTAEGAAELKAKWLENHGNARSIAVLNATTEFQPLSFSPVDAAMVDMKRLSLVDVAHAFGMPAWALDMSTDSTTYQNIADARSVMIDVCLQDWATRVEDALSALLPYGTRLYVDFTSYRTPVTDSTSAPATFTQSRNPTAAREDNADD